MRQKSDAFLPLSKLELTLGLVEAYPTRLPQLVVEFPGDFCFRCQRFLRVCFFSLGPLTVALGLEPLKASNDCQNADRGHHRITNSRLGLLSPVSFSNARVDVMSLFTAERRPKVFDELFTFGQVEPRFEQVILLFSAAQPEL